MSEVNAGAAHAGAQSESNLDLIIVGAGFAGMYMLHRARGLGLAARVFEVPIAYVALIDEN